MPGVRCVGVGKLPRWLRCSPIASHSSSAPRMTPSHPRMHLPPQMCYRPAPLLPRGRYTAVGSRTVQGRTYGPVQDFAYQSYNICCGDGSAWGDGVTPVECSIGARWWLAAGGGGAPWLHPSLHTLAMRPNGRARPTAA